MSEEHRTRPLETRRELFERLFGPISGKTISLIGIGGGGDITSTVPLTLELERLGATVIPGGLTWKRRVHDPKGLPRAISELKRVRHVAPHVGVGRGDMVTVDGIRHVEAQIAEALGDREVLVIDPSGGSAAVGSGLAAAAQQLGIDAFVGVDVGGDVLCHGHERSLESPLCDQTLLHALSSRGSQVALASLGTDGEIQPRDFIARFSQVIALDGFRGAIFPQLEDLDAWHDVVQSAKTESSKFALGVRRRLSEARVQELHDRLLEAPLPLLEELLKNPEPLPLRDGSRTGHLSDLTASFLIFDAAAVWRSGGFAPLWRAEASLQEMHQVLAGKGIKTEFGAG